MEESESIVSEKETKVESNIKSKLPKEEFSTDSRPNIFLLICIVGVSLGIGLEIINLRNRTANKDEEAKSTRKYWVYSAKSDVDNREGLLKHVHLVLERIGYQKSTNESAWDLLWSHDYPFRVLYPNLSKLKSYQKVNHYPGTGFITNKVDLATSDSKYIPKAFKLPEQKEEFLKYARDNPELLFLEKQNQHRGVYLKNVSDIDLSSGQKFVQEYVQKPFLVDGHRFDIGVYVVLTSVNPLRVYWYKGDVLFRYCPAKYYPFDSKILDKYVVGDDYLPTWEVPSLAHPYTALGFSMMEAFNIYVKSKGKDPSKVWTEMQNAISDIFFMKEKHIIEALKNYPSQDNFFELTRVDLVVDEDLNVYILEANMSPNLSSAHYPPNQHLYEQVIYNLFSITGVADHISQYQKSHSSHEAASATKMVSSQKNIAVWGQHCSMLCMESCEDSDLCQLCKPCLDSNLRQSFLKAHKEHTHRGDFRRLIPAKMVPHTNIIENDDFEKLSPKNKLQYLWYQGKCNIDETWCT